MGLVLSWWRFPKKLILWLGSWVVQLAKVTWGAHCWKLKSQCISRVTRDLANLWDDLQNALTTRILSVTLIPFTHNIYTIITHKSEKRLFRGKPEKGFYNTPTLLKRATHPQVRNPCSLFSSPFPLLYLKRRFVS